jgi:AAA domain
MGAPYSRHPTRAQELGSANYLIKGILPVRLIGLLLGDSGLGKSPLMYQAGVCIAAGQAFLGRETRKGSVVIADFENGLSDMVELVGRVSRHLGLAEPPNENLLLWSLNDCDQRYGQPGHTLLDMLHSVRPSLIIIDSLSSYSPEAEAKNPTANTLLRDFRQRVVSDCGTFALFVHHRRKLSTKPTENAGPLATANLIRWFQDARGASALINGADVRLGVDISDISTVLDDDETIVLRGFGRVRGQFGPLYLGRHFDENGDPLGYFPLAGARLLFNPEQEKAYEDLPQQFSFKQAKQAYGRQDQATSDMLRKCAELNLVQKVARGRYAKMVEASGVGVDGVSE